MERIVQRFSRFILKTMWKAFTTWVNVWIWLFRKLPIWMLILIGLGRIV